MPAALPEHARRAHGTADRRDRRPRFAAVDRVPGDPEPPEWFCDLGKATWAHVCEVLRRRDTLGLDDYWSLCGLVSAVVDYRRLGMDIKENGRTRTVITVNGVPFVRIRPEVKLLREVNSSLRKWLREFGLTPKSIQVR